MLDTFLLQTYQACAYAGGSGTGTLQQEWVEISTLIVLAGFAIAALIYTIGNIFSTSFKDRLKQLAKAEAVQAVFGLMIIFALILVGLFSCTVSSSVTSQVTGTGMAPFTFANYYVANLLFTNGFGLVAAMYSTSIQYTSEGLAIDTILDSVGNPVGTTFQNYISALSPLSFLTSLAGIGIGPSQSLGLVYSSYALLYLGVFSVIVTISFAALLLLFLMLPLIQYGALVVVVPVAIVMRLLVFTGPRLREAADHLLAIGIAFYFVLPLTLVMDSYIVSWTYCIAPMTTASGNCNPYYAYVGPYTENSVVLNSFLTTNTVQITNPFGGGSINAPSNLFSDSQILTGGAGVGLLSFFQIAYAPSTATDYAIKIAQYTFQSSILIVIDYAITLAFALSLAKAFAKVNGFFAVGQFW